MREEAGEWLFGGTVEGLGVQDVWIVPPRDQRPNEDALYEYGSSLRFYMPELEIWRSS
ncbi:MAG: hypothetical protein NVS3B5_05700 [Sphingomicrobium sp.]